MKSQKTQLKPRAMWAWPNHLTTKGCPLWVTRGPLVSSTQTMVRVAVIPRGQHKALVAKIARKLWPESERGDGRHTVRAVLDCLGVIEKPKRKK